MRILALRLLALMCLAAAFPLAALKYPWMASTFIDTAASYHEPYPHGSESYLADRRRLFIDHHVASGLYLLASAALVGLTLIATQRARRSMQAGFWILAAVTGAVVSSYEKREFFPGIDMMSTDPILFIWLPLSITGLSAIGLIITVVMPSPRKLPNNGLKRTGHGGLAPKG